MMDALMTRLDDYRLLKDFWEYVAGLRDARKSLRVVRFGDSSELADVLVDLVLCRRKRATASLAVDYVTRGQPLPNSGDLSVVLDGRNRPRCIIRTVQVEVKRIGDVDEAFAYDEGEGDGSLAWWTPAHIRYFARCHGHTRTAIGRDTEVVLERFVVSWPSDTEPTDSAQPDPLIACS